LNRPPPLTKSDCSSVPPNFAREAIFLPTIFCLCRGRVSSELIVIRFPRRSQVPELSQNYSNALPLSACCKLPVFFCNFSCCWDPTLLHSSIPFAAFFARLPIACFVLSLASPPPTHFFCLSRLYLSGIFEIFVINAISYPLS